MEVLVVILTIVFRSCVSMKEGSATVIVEMVNCGSLLYRGIT